MSKPPAPSDTADKFMLRLPPGMREQIAELAKANNRSMNSEIIARLQASVDSDKTQSGDHEIKTENSENIPMLFMISVIDKITNEFREAAIQGKQTPITSAFLEAMHKDRIIKTIETIESIPVPGSDRKFKIYL